MTLVKFLEFRDEVAALKLALKHLPSVLINVVYVTIEIKKAHRRRIHNHFDSTGPELLLVECLQFLRDLTQRRQFGLLIYELDAFLVLTEVRLPVERDTIEPAEQTLPRVRHFDHLRVGLRKMLIASEESLVVLPALVYRYYQTVQRPEEFVSLCLVDVVSADHDLVKESLLVVVHVRHTWNEVQHRC